MRKIYFSTAIDFINPVEISKKFQAVESELRAAGFHLSNLSTAQSITSQRYEASPEEVVQQALSLIRESDFVLLDLSLRNHTYIGCICEMVYAYLWQKPVVVFVGTSGNESRPWLRFHASHICATLRDAVDWIRKHTSSSIGKEV